MQVLLEKHKGIKTSFFTTRTISRTDELMGRPLNIRPSALYCYIVGRNITARLDQIIAQIPAKSG